MISINRKAVRAAGGTQSDELAAKIKSVTSATTVGAVFVYDTRNDSDSGAWRKKARGSWYYEDLNTATRGGRREFPSVALLVGDAGADTLTIYDLDDPSMPMWMVFQQGGAGAATNAIGTTSATFSSIAALNGIICVGGAGAAYLNLQEINLLTEEIHRHSSASDGGFYQGNIAERNGGKGWGGTMEIIVDYRVNDIAMTVVEGAEIGALGLPEVTIGVATDGGVSVIHGGSGAVYDIAGTGLTHDDTHNVFFTEDGMVGYSFEASGSVTHPWGVGLRRIPFADETIGGFTNTSNLERYNPIVNGNVSGLTTQTTEYNSSNSALNAITPTGKNGLAIGYGDRLSIVKRNTGHMEEGAVAFVTSDYNSGYQLGDIRFAGLANSATADRSVKANTLTQTGSVGSADVATGAELKEYNSFSTSNYLSRASADLGTSMNLGTTATVMAWVKVTAGTNYQTVCNYNTTSAGVGWQMLINEEEKPYFYVYGASGTVSSDFGPALTAGKWHQVVGVNTGSRVQIYVDGKLGSDAAGVAGSMDNSSANYNVGIHTNQSSLPWLGSLSLVRVSKTAVTPQQVKEIYEAERPLFQAGAKCLLQTDASSNENLINDLAYDSTADLLHVYQQGTGVTETMFRGLEAVDTFGGKAHGWNYSNAALGATAGGIKATARTGSGGGVLVDLPAIDVRGDINTADTKLPDDGKIRFSGVTTSNGGDVIGHIPIGENENVTVKAHVTAKGYGSNLGTHYANYVLTEQFYRAAGGDVTSAVAEASIVSQESAAGLDATLGVDTSADTAKITVTGDASDRIVWTALVEVIRDAEKSYER